MPLPIDPRTARIVLMLDRDEAEALAGALHSEDLGRKELLETVAEWDRLYGPEPPSDTEPV